MQSVEGYPAELDVLEPTSLVIVNGEPVEVASLKVTRELSGSMPAQVESGSGLTAATGSVTWNVGKDVQDRAAHPWDGSSFPPKPTDEVLAFAGYRGALVRQLTGSIDDALGSVATGGVSSKLVDPIDKLKRHVSYPAMLNAMPPLNEGGTFRRVGLQSIFVTDRILRECGFYATPAPAPNCIFSAPQMGSAWPEIGTVALSHMQGFPTASTVYSITPWGLGLRSGDVLYRPDLSGANNSGRLNRTMQITLKADEGHGSGGQSYVRTLWGSSYITLTVTSARTVIASIFHDSTLTTICTLSIARAASADVFTLRVASTGACTLFANNGESVVGTAALPSVMTGEHMDGVRVYVTDDNAPRIGGAQVNFAPSNVVNSPQTAHLAPADSTSSLLAFPRIESRNALDVLKEQAAAECAAMWIDEHGSFRWVNRDRLAGTAPVATLTAKDDVVDIGWSSSAAGVRSRVVVSSLDASISISRFTNQLAWQGRGESLEPGQDSEVIASPPANTDWVGVDESLKRMPGGGDVAEFNRGRGTWAGGVQVDDDSTQWANLDGNSSFAVGMEKISESVYKFTTQAGSPVAGRTIELRTLDEDSETAVWPSKRNMDLPLLRARAVVAWTDHETVGLHVGPANAAILDHNAGPWVQHPTALQTLADWLSAQSFEPKPVLRDLAVIPDFRRQLGDVVWIEDGENMRIRLKLIITKLTTTVSAGSADQTVAGRILEVQSYGATNEQLDDHVGNRTNAGFDTLWADATNAQLDNNPLGRG